MAKFIVKSEAFIKYMMTTWQGEVSINETDIKYRYSEDDNGAELYVFDGSNWVLSNLEDENHKILWSAIMAWGNPEEMGQSGTEVDIDDEEMEDYF